MIDNFISNESFPDGFCSKVYANKTQVLKVPFQGEELTSGFWANIDLQNAGGPKILDSDPETGRTLMERIRPGNNLVNETEEVARRAFYSIAREVRDLTITDKLMPLRQYFGTFSDPILDELLATSPEPVWLHGDLHHSNILYENQTSRPILAKYMPKEVIEKADKRRYHYYVNVGYWRPIDPKGLVGDPAFEAVAFLRNPLQKLKEIPNFLELTQERLDYLFNELGFDRRRMILWSLMDMRESAPERESDSPWWIVHETMEKLAVKL